MPRRDLAGSLAMQRNRWPEQGRDPRMSGVQRVTELLRWINRQYPRPHLTLKGAGRELGVSDRYLGKTFKKHTGQTFHAYLRALRAKEAANLLRSTPLTIKEIAFATGYTRTPNLTRDFKKVYGPPKLLSADVSKITALGSGFKKV